MKPLWKKGDVVTIYQLSMAKGLMVEGKATVVSFCGNDGDEHYMVRFHQKNGKIESQAYERFIDREGQTGEAQTYIDAFNKRIGYAA